MDSKDSLSRSLKGTELGNNSDYYKYVFKKTEKIVYAVFYVLRANKGNFVNDVVVREVEETAQRTMKRVFHTLRTTSPWAEQETRELGYLLIELESGLRIAEAARYIEREHLQAFVVEIDSVLRSLKDYTKPQSEVSFSEFSGTIASKARVRHERKTLHEAGSSLYDTGVARAGGENRTERILAVLKDKGQASIKDISEVVTDCSEKTIQRELNALIKDSKIRREGERRWSKYMLIEE